ncbi:MAG TPA: iron-containing alcohol dehydrogenase, partial [Candidatus Limiplasma sp.]|nr:iron-containing alcohol dehydrogenase [Candidatus Limiplasma sp.]
SSMIRDRVKVTLYNACPDAIIADTMIMKDAPERMLQAGLGDMLAKYIALCEWRISHIVTGEYYCEEVAGLMRNSLAKIVSAAPRLLERDPEVIGAVAEGLILSGVAMAFAQVSRPASGLEHYFSHLWEMFALDR